MSHRIDVEHLGELLGSIAGTVIEGWHGYDSASLKEQERTHDFDDALRGRINYFGLVSPLGRFAFNVAVMRDIYDWDGADPRERRRMELTLGDFERN